MGCQDGLCVNYEASETLAESVMGKQVCEEMLPHSC